MALPKIIAIVGPTSSGKTKLGIELAKKYNGEVVSADSRQVYKKMTIGTAKPPGVWQERHGKETFIVEGVPHYMVDIVDPGYQMSLADFKSQAEQHIDDILSRGKLPILVGGTGLYIWAIVDNLDMPRIPPNKTLRRSLEKRSLEDLLVWLKKLDQKSYDQIDVKNPRRVIRALEVAILSGGSFSEQRKVAEPRYDVLQIGIKRDWKELCSRIEASIDDQIAHGLIEEATGLMRQKYGWSLPSMSSIGYRQMGEYLEDRCTKEEAIAEIKQATKKYAKRQLTWFKRDKRIVWINGPDSERSSSLIEHFLKK